MPFYLGKCIAWGDFIQSKAMHGLIQRLNQWIDPALTQAMQSPHFSEAYAQWGIWSRHIVLINIFTVPPICIGTYQNCW